MDLADDLPHPTTGSFIKFLRRQAPPVAIEELQRIHARPPLGGMGVTMLGPTLLEYGSEEQGREMVIGWTAIGAVVGVVLLLAAALFALLGEGLEFLASALGAQRAGASRRSTVFAVIGSAAPVSLCWGCLPSNCIQYRIQYRRKRRGKHYAYAPAYYTAFSE